MRCEVVDRFLKHESNPLNTGLLALVPGRESGETGNAGHFHSPVHQPERSQAGGSLAASRRPRQRHAFTAVKV